MPRSNIPNQRIRRDGKTGRREVAALTSKSAIFTLRDGVKRAFDLGVAVTGLFLLSPLLLIVAIAIKLDSRGPVFFRQLRHGYNEQTISVINFRTTRVVEQFVDLEQVQQNDARVTRVGHVLRRTNIDELPQLLNVLVGDMSIVGPAPLAIAHSKMFEEVIAPFSGGRSVKPGITGWAQVNGYHRETDTIDKIGRRVEYDLYYIDNWSLWFDLKLIFVTLLSKQAYLIGSSVAAKCIHNDPMNNLFENK